MNKKDSLISRIFLQRSLWFLFVALVVFLSFGGFLKAADEAASPASKPASPQAPSVLATADGETPGFRVEVQELKRSSGDTVTLKFVMINGSDKEFAFHANLASKEFGSIDGVNLVDPVGKKKYLVIRDSEDHCLCSRNVPNLKPNSRVNLHAKFPAPPESVKKITVEIPHFTPMDDVPINQ